MSGFPRAKSDGLAATEAAGQWILRNAAGDEIARLDAHTAAIWRLADGAVSVESMVDRLGASREQVWAALDRLYDWGLLEARLTPPAGAPLSRRGMLGTTARGAGWLGLAAVSVAAPAFAESEQSREEAAKRGQSTLTQETHEKSATAQESARKHQDRASEQQKKHAEQANEQDVKHAGQANAEEKRRLEQAREEQVKHGQGANAEERRRLEQAEEQKEKRSDRANAEDKRRLEQAEEQKIKRSDRGNAEEKRRLEQAAEQKYKREGHSQ